MHARHVLAVAALAVFAAHPAHAQFKLGVGGGAGIGSRGGTESAAHGIGFVQFKLPVLPGVRGDVLGVDAPSGIGKISVALNVVWSPPIPIVHPYVIGGWGKYGIDKSETSQTGWNIGAGVSFAVGRGLFVEFRRHQRISRDLISIGLTF